MRESVLLEQRGSMPISRRKSLTSFPFEVPKGVEALRLRFDYQPRSVDDPSLARRAVEEQFTSARQAGVEINDDDRRIADEVAVNTPMRNLLNLVVIDPGGQIRGRWDHNLLEDEPTDDVIAADWASPGYVPGPVSAGTWLLVLEAHELLGPCRFQLRLTGTGRPAPRSTPPGGRPAAFPSACEYSEPLPDGWLRAELHCHTTASDGVFTPAELVDRARILGLDLLALTDHNATDGADLLPEATVIRGCEITTFHGHFLALGLDDGSDAPGWYDARQGRVLDLEEISTAVRQRGALFGVAHPFVQGNPVCCGCHAEIDLPPSTLDLVEVWSRGAEDPVALKQALRFFDALRSSGHRATAIAGRDWHGPAQEQAATGRPFPATVVHAAPDPRAVLAALRQGACYLSTGPVIELELATPKRLAVLGQQLTLDDSSTARARIAVRGLLAPATLRLLSGGTIHFQQEISGDTRLEVPGIEPAAGGIRVEVWCDDQPVVITNPIELVRVEA